MPTANSRLSGVRRELYPKATTPALFVDSDGEDLLGVLHRPARPGPHPVAVILPGFPGHECVVDLASSLRRAGYAAVSFRYRGSWGVGGTWSWRNVLEDAGRVLEAVREPSTVDVHRLDPRRIALIGYGVGGFAALMTAAADPEVAVVVSISGFNPAVVARLSETDPSARAAFVDTLQSELLPQPGVSGDRLVAEVQAAGPRWDLTRLAPRLADRPVLLVATRDHQAVTPIALHHHPVVDAYESYPMPGLVHRVVPWAQPAERIEQVRRLAGFLDRRLPAEG